MYDRGPDVERLAGSFCHQAKAATAAFLWSRRWLEPPVLGDLGLSCTARPPLPEVELRRAGLLLCHRSAAQGSEVYLCDFNTRAVAVCKRTLSPIHLSPIHAVKL